MTTWKARRTRALPSAPCRGKETAGSKPNSLAPEKEKKREQ
jgi:hypothetical protein